jgi:hypothetical protein
MKEINMSDKTEEKIEEKSNIETPKEKDSMKKKIETSEEPLTKKKSILILSGIGLILVLGIVAFYYFGIYKYNPKAKNEDVVNISQEYIMSQLSHDALAEILLDPPSEPKTEESPINGMLFTKAEMEELMTRRPVAVMINNHAVSRPQSGVTSADLVYEALAESGITRYMAFFWSQGPEKVGSVRSARQYFLEWLSPYDPLYIHIGWADTDDPRTDARGNIIAYGIKDVGIIGSWVWNDGRRVAPHNKYQSVIGAWEYAESKGWDGFTPNFESWKFKNDADPDQRGDAYRYKVVFHNRLNNGGLYDVIWEYDKTTNSYKRWVGGNPAIDQETNKQVTAKVVVIQENKMTSAYDSKGRIIITTIGEGDAIILMDGKEINGKWKKESRTDRTTFYDNEGNEIEFNRGRIWIASISPSYGEFDIIEQ